MAPSTAKPNNRGQKVRLLKSVCLALFVFFALSYNLRYPADPAGMTAAELVRARIASYGFTGNLYVAGLTALFWLWFRPP